MGKVNTAIQTILRRIGNILAIASLIFISVAFYANAGEMPSIAVSFLSFFSLFLCLAINGAIVLILAYIWQQILFMLCATISLKNAFIVIGKSQAAKYIPGNVFQFVSRVSLGVNLGIPASKTMVSIAYETIISISAALSFSLITVNLINNSGIIFFKSIQEETLQYLLPAFAIIGIALILAPIMFQKFRKLLCKYQKFFDLKKILSLTFLFSINFFLFGISLQLLVKNVFCKSTELSVFAFASVFALAWLIGYLTPGSPGGIGIREAAMVALFSGSLNEPLILSLSLLFRIVNLAADALCFCLALFLEKHHNSEAGKLDR